MTGAFSQASSGQTTFVIGGTPASGQFGKLTSTGAAVLDGTIAAQAASGYTPVQGAQYTVMTFASQAGGPTFNGGVTFGVQFNPKDVVVTVASEPVDLAVTAVTLTTATATPGQSVTVNYTVKNQAQAATRPRAYGPTRFTSRRMRSSIRRRCFLAGRPTRGPSLAEAVTVVRFPRRCRCSCPGRTTSSWWPTVATRCRTRTGPTTSPPRPPHSARASPCWRRARPSRGRWRRASLCTTRSTCRPDRPSRSPATSPRRGRARSMLPSSRSPPRARRRSWRMTAARPPRTC